VELVLRASVRDEPAFGCSLMRNCDPHFAVLKLLWGGHWVRKINELLCCCFVDRAHLELICGGVGAADLECPHAGL